MEFFKKLFSPTPNCWQEKKKPNKCDSDRKRLKFNGLRLREKPKTIFLVLGAFFTSHLSAFVLLGFPFPFEKVILNWYANIYFEEKKNIIIRSRIPIIFLFLFLPWFSLSEFTILRFTDDVFFFLLAS